MKKCNVVRATAQGVLSTIDNKTMFLKYKRINNNESTKKTSRLPKEDLFKLNKEQSELYYSLIKGFNAYTLEELNAMSKKEKNKIKNNYNSAQRAIQIIKAKKICKAETKLLNDIFPNAKIGVHDYDWYLDIPKYLTLRRLNISKKTVIYDLIKRKLLPFDFFLLG